MQCVLHGNDGLGSCLASSIIPTWHACHFMIKCVWLQPQALTGNKKQPSPADSLGSERCMEGACGSSIHEGIRMCRFDGLRMTHAAQCMWRKGAVQKKAILGCTGMGVNVMHDTCVHGKELLLYVK